MPKLHEAGLEVDPNELIEDREVVIRTQLDKSQWIPHV